MPNYCAARLCYSLLETNKDMEKAAVTEWNRTEKRDTGTTFSTRQTIWSHVNISKNCKIGWRVLQRVLNAQDPLQHWCWHRTRGVVRILLDILSAFNTIQPLLLHDKLVRMQVDPRLVSWITCYLTNRLKDIISDTMRSSKGAPQGTVLAPLLFTLYTSHFSYNSDSCSIQKFAGRTRRWSAGTLNSK